MKKGTFGCIRNLDQLGRIVIPMEIRKELRIQMGDPLDMSVRDGEIVLRPVAECRPDDDIAYLLEQYGENDEARGKILELKKMIDRTRKKCER